MENAIITASGSILVAALTFYLTKRHQLNMQWRDDKLKHYRELLSSISDLAIHKGDKDAAQRFALAANTITLVAPQYVVTLLMDFHSGIREAPDQYEGFLKKLVLGIRKDLKLPGKDNAKTFKYYLINGKV